MDLNAFGGNPDRLTIAAARQRAAAKNGYSFAADGQMADPSGGVAPTGSTTTAVPARHPVNRVDYMRDDPDPFAHFDGSWMDRD